MTTPYLLAHEPDGRSVTARENLTDILERELLGPAGGPNEILAGPPDSAYLIGRIAPVRLTDKDWDEDPATDVGDELDALESRGVPVTAVDDAATTADEDTAEDGPQRRGLIIPASMGLRLQIPTNLTSFTVTTVKDLVPKETTAYHLRDTVVLRVDRYDDKARGRRLIEIALCNDAETPSKIPTNAWLFQTKLAVTADGAEVFLPVRDLQLDDDDEF